MTHLGYVEKTGSGSKREFVHVETDASLKLHEPHPHNILKEYAIKDIVHFLQEKHHI
jgi:hypothetical protein